MTKAKTPKPGRPMKVPSFPKALKHAQSFHRRLCQSYVEHSQALTIDHRVTDELAPVVFDLFSRLAVLKHLTDEAKAQLRSIAGDDDALELQSTFVLLLAETLRELD